MADNIYVVNGIATGPDTITISDDGTGIDMIKLDGVFDGTTSLDLNWTSNAGTATSASGLYFNPQNIGHRLIVNGVIENATGSDGHDFIQGNELANVIFGDAFATGLGQQDTLWGGDGNDTIFGGSGADTMLGDNGDDLLFGDTDADTITGGGGVDTIEGGAGADSLAGGSSAGDRVSYAHSAAGVSVSLTFGDFTFGTGGDAEGDRIFGFTDAEGSDFSDVLTDNVAGTVAFGGNDNRFYGNAGTDVLTMGGGNDQGYGGDDNDTIRGGAGDDQLFGGGGRDSLFGDDGNDLLNGDAGGDTMAGGAGDDTYVCEAAADIVVEAVGAGRDLILAGVNWALQSTVEDLTLTGTALRGAGNFSANVVTGNDLANRLQGFGGDDTLLGGGGDDSLIGDSGNDRLDGQGGNDTMAGGVGDDSYVCGGMFDVVTETVGEGHDLILAGVNWTLQAGVEDLTLTGTAAVGQGNSFANVLTGNAGDNALRGFSGDDTLAGGRGLDVLTGGGGADVFDFNTLADSAVISTGRDTIADFRASDLDKIDLRDIDANATQGGNQKFHFIGPGFFTGTSGELRAAQSGSSVIVSCDVNGDHIMDSAITVQNVTALVAADFVL